MFGRLCELFLISLTSVVLSIRVSREDEEYLRHERGILVRGDGRCCYAAPESQG